MTKINSEQSKVFFKYFNGDKGLLEWEAEKVGKSLNLNMSTAKLLLINSLVVYEYHYHDDENTITKVLVRGCENKVSTDTAIKFFKIAVGREIIGQSKGKNERNDLSMYSFEDLKDIASTKPKDEGCWVSIMFLLIGISLGLIYWFIQPFIFSYDVISPFVGFLLFVFGSIIIAIVINAFMAHPWKDYNQLIDKAINEIERRIKSGEGNPDELEKMRKFIVEKKLASNTVSDDDYYWYNQRYCLACGKKFTKQPVVYAYNREDVKSWREGAMRKTVRVNKTVYVNVCHDCYNKLSEKKSVTESNEYITYVISALLILVTGIVTGIFEYFNYGSFNGHFWDIIGTGIVGMVIAASVGLIIIYPIAYIVSLPFRKKMKNNWCPKWDFDNIPEIRRFLNQEKVRLKND